MDWLTFIGRVLDAAAWPITVLAMLLLLRTPLSGLIPLLQRFKYKDLELEFGRQLQEVRREIQVELPGAAAPRTMASGMEAIVHRVAKVSPRAAVLEAWREIEDALVRAAQRRPLDVRGHPAESPLALIRALQQGRVLDPGKIGILHELRALRNTAAHGPDLALSRDAALEYARVARTIVGHLDSL
jgi:hypothetical protein